MKKTQVDLFDIVEQVLDNVFVSKIYTFDMYRYLRSNEVKRPVVNEFVDSITAKNIQTTVDELNLYLESTFALVGPLVKILPSFLKYIISSDFITTFLFLFL